MQRTAPGKQPANASGTHLWLVMMKAHRTLERLATHSIESSEVCLSDFAVMEMLLHKGPQPVNEIGRRVELTSGAITTAVDRLESRGLVTREAHPSDRRARIVRLTAAGEEQAARIFADHKAAMDRRVEWTDRVADLSGEFVRVRVGINSRSGDGPGGC